jgi:hypothetical protein
MAYDDDSKFGFRDFEDFFTIFERYASSPENLSVVRVMQLVQAVHRIAGGRQVERLDTRELAQGLRERGLATVPFDTVVRVAEFVASVSPKDDVLAKVTLRDVQRIVSH